MYKRLAALLMLLALLCAALPAQADKVSHFAVLWDGENGAKADQVDVLRNFMLYSSWQCTYLNVWEEQPLAGYDAYILCIGDDQELPKDTARFLRETEKQVFVIGRGGLKQIDPEAAWYTGDVLLRCEVESGAMSEMLLMENGLMLLPREGGTSKRGTAMVDGKEFPLCQTRGHVTHFAWFEADEPILCAELMTCLQAWQWPYDNAPTVFGQYLVMEYVYPFMDPADMMARTEVLDQEGIPYMLAVTSVFSNGEYPAMKRFCEFLRYAQSRGVGIILRVPFVSIEQVELEDLIDHMDVAYEAYAAYGVYPVAVQTPVAWLKCERGIEALQGYRTVFLFESDDKLQQEPLPDNAAYRDGHNIIAPAWDDQRAFTSSYAQAIYLDAEMDIEEMRVFVQRLKSSRRVFKSLADTENVVYTGDMAVQAVGGALFVNGKRQSTAYVPFTYETDYTFDRGITQFFKEQIETSNKFLMIFVVVACTIFTVMMLLFRRQIKRDLVLGKPMKKQKLSKKGQEKVQDTESMPGA